MNDVRQEETSDAQNEHGEEGVETIELLDTKKLRSQIAKCAREVQKLKSDRESINAEIQAEYSGLEAQGVPKDAIKRALKDNTLDETQLAEQDHYYLLCRSVLKKPIQMSLLMAETGETH